MFEEIITSNEVKFTVFEKKVYKDEKLKISGLRELKQKNS